MKHLKRKQCCVRVFSYKSEKSIVNSFLVLILLLGEVLLHLLGKNVHRSSIKFAGVRADIHASNAARHFILNPKHTISRSSATPILRTLDWVQCLTGSMFYETDFVIQSFALKRKIKLCKSVERIVVFLVMAFANSLVLLNTTSHVENVSLIFLLFVPTFYL